MRGFAVVLLTMSLAASPLLARSAGETGKEEPPAAASSTPAAADQPTKKTLPAVTEKSEAVKPESSAIETEVQDLRTLVEEQRAELEEQRAALKAAETKMKELEERMSPAPAQPAAVATASAATPATPSAAITPGTPAASTATLGTPSPSAMVAMKPQEQPKESPLYFKIGGAEFYPLGFMDLTGVYRTTNLGGIGTNFGSIAFTNTVAGRDSELRFSAQNSRIGLRTHAKFGPGDATGYLEADFLGYSVPNLDITSNSDTLRMRLYWIDYKQGKIEVFGGQSWSFMTPNRNGLSALPGDLFYGQEMDTNYQLGLTWARQSAFRVILHPNNNWAMGVSLENPEQTLPSSVVEPFPPSINAAYGNQFDTNSGDTSNPVSQSNPNRPNLAPDVIVKSAWDAKPGGHNVHFDVAGLFRTFRAVNLIATPSSITAANTVRTTIHGGGAEAGLNLEVFKNFRWISTAYWSYAGGRYIASTGGPDLIVKPDGTLSGVHSGSAISGFEWTMNPRTLFYGYGSLAYFGQNVNAVVTMPAATGAGAMGTCTTTTFYGYGNGPGTSVPNAGTIGTCAAPNNSSSSANRLIYEPTFGVVQTFWRNPNYGDLKLITQYSYVSRAPWFVSATSPATAHTSMVYIDLRYDLP